LKKGSLTQRLGPKRKYPWSSAATSQELVETFLKILPYERSRLTQSKVDATTTSTTFVRPDLSGLER
jgi:hypothetical protein